MQKFIKYFLCIFLACFIVGCNNFIKNNHDLNLPEKKVSLNSKKEVKARIIREATNQGLSPILALSVAKQESDFEKKAKNVILGAWLKQFLLKLFARTNF